MRNYSKLSTAKKTPRQIDAAQEYYARRQARTDLRAYCEYTIPYYRYSPYHDKIIKPLEAVERGEIDRLMFLIPPRHYKTTIASKGFPSYYIGKNKSKQIITASYGAGLASEIGYDVRNMIASNEFKKVFGEVRLRQDSQARNRWHTNNGGIYVAAGVGGPITGKGANLAVVDDPHKDREEADSLIMSDKVWNWWRSTFYSRLAPDAAIVLLMQRWNDYDLAARLIDEMEKDPEADQWTIVKLPALQDKHGNATDDWKHGRALWPGAQGYDVPKLRRIRVNVDLRNWNSQYQQEPNVEGGNIVKRHYFRYWSNTPDDNVVQLPKKFTTVLQSWDLSFKDAAQSDMVVGQVWGIHGADRYLLDEVRDRMSFVASLRAFVALSNKWPQATRKLVEEKANGAALESMLKRKIAGIIMINPKSDKSSRLWAATSSMESGNVFLPNPNMTGYSWVNDYIEELVKFPNARFDDRVDATSQALNYIFEKTKGTDILDVLSQF